METSCFTRELKIITTFGNNMKRLHCGQARAQGQPRLLLNDVGNGSLNHILPFTGILRPCLPSLSLSRCCSCRHSQLCLRFFGIFIVVFVVVAAGAVAAVADAAADAAAVGLAKICIGHKCQHPCGIVRRRLGLQRLLDMNVHVGYGECACVAGQVVSPVPRSKPLLQSACTFVTCLVS